MTAEQSPNGAGPQIVGPSPVPMSWDIQPAEFNGQQVVVMQIAHPVGVFVGFMSPQEAQRIGGQLRAMGKRATSGLFLPPGAALPTDDDGEPT